MYAITGITGKVGGELGRRLLAAGQPVRAVVRDPAKGAAWAERGCEIAHAEMEDGHAARGGICRRRGRVRSAAIRVRPGTGLSRSPAGSSTLVVSGLAAARPNRVLCLSTIGADAPHDNLLTQRTLLEQALRGLDIPVTFLRPAWFMENAQWDLASARDEGVLHSFLQPADRTFPMVATRDIGALAAELIRQDWTGERIVELEGPARVSPKDLARAFAAVLGREVRVEIVPRASWEALFRAQGMRNPRPRIRMLDGFNEGWIAFQEDSRPVRKGTTTLIEVVAELAAGD